MRSFLTKSCAAFLVFSMAAGAFPTQWVFAQTAVAMASDDETLEIQHLIQAGYLDANVPYASAKSLTEDQVTDALVAIQERLKSVDLKTLQTPNPSQGGASPYQLADLQTLLQLVQDYSELLHDRKVSAWLYENRLQKMIQILTASAPAPQSTAVESPTAAVVAPPTVIPPTPTATATAVPGPTFSDLNALNDSIKDQNQRFLDLQTKTDQKFQDADADNQLLKTKEQETQDEMKLVKNLMDTYESNLQKMNERLDQISDKANQKTLTDEELEQELTIMHKDLRDNTQDLTVLKQQVSLLDAPQKTAQDPLDDFLSSKWLAGGALVLGLAALTVALTRK
jgi:hypothetical protein